MDLQKQPVLATKEQIRLAELTQTGNDVTTAHDDIALKRVKKVIELTRCTQSQAEVALIDSEGNVEDAVARLLDNPEKLVLWSQQVKNKKVKTATQSMANESKVGHGRRADSQRGRQRQDGAGQPNVGPKQYQSIQPRLSARSTQTKEQNGPSGGPRARSERQGHKLQGRTFTGGAFRRDKVGNEQLTKSDGTNNGTAMQQGADARGWTNGEGDGVGNVGWSDSTGWDDEKKVGDGGDSGFSTVEASYADTPGLEKNDEWKNGPRVFMPSSAAVVVTETSTNNGTKSASNWPALDNFTPSETTEHAVVQKPKTFAAVAATKKAPLPRAQPSTIAQRQSQQPKLLPSDEPMMAATSTTQKEPIMRHTNLETKISDGPVVEWSNSIDWGNSLSPQPADQSEFPQHSSDQLASTSTSNVVFNNTSVLSMNVNQEYTDQLKNAIGLGPNSQPQHQIGAANTHQSTTSVSNSCDSTVDYIPQHTHLQHLTSNSRVEMDQTQEKVEFVTGDALPPPSSTSYQFGFNFGSAKDSESTWGHQQRISSVENSTGAMLTTMSNIPTTSSSVSAHFNAISQQAQAIEAQQRINNGPTRPANALSFSDTASVNFPPSSGQSGGIGHAIPSNFTAQQSDSSHSAHQQQQLLPQNKMFTPAANPSMVSAPPAVQQHLQHQQHQAQTIFHQTSAAAVPQFPNYNMPYMYSPVAPAQTLTAPNAEIDRFLIQQYAAPYSQLDLQMGAMSIGPPTTLAPSHHRATMDSYMENKFGQQQQNVNQAGNNGHYQQSQQTQQRGLAQSEPATLLGGPHSHVGPPPGFGMPTAPTQPSYVQPANIHSLFQMPTYPHPYQHPQYMMSNANRLQTAQRPAQTSPPEANVQNQRRAGNEAQGYAGGAVQDSTGEQHSAGVSQQYGNNFNHKYRSYM